MDIKLYSARKYFQWLKRIAENPYFFEKPFDLEPLFILNPDHSLSGFEIKNFRFNFPAIGSEGSIRASEIGIVVGDKYQIVRYSFHFEHLCGSFRFDSHINKGTQYRPHANCPRDETENQHFFYDEGYEIAKEMNFIFMIEFCHHFIKTHKHPLDSNYLQDYECLKVKWRKRIK